MIYVRRGTSFSVITIGREARYSVTCLYVKHKEKLLLMLGAPTYLSLSPRGFHNTADVFSCVHFFNL